MAFLREISSFNSKYGETFVQGTSEADRQGGQVTGDEDSE